MSDQTVRRGCARTLEDCWGAMPRMAPSRARLPRLPLLLAAAPPAADLAAQIQENVEAVLRMAPAGGGGGSRGKAGGDAPRELKELRDQIDRWAVLPAAGPAVASCLPASRCLLRMGPACEASWQLCD